MSKGWKSLPIIMCLEWLQTQCIASIEADGQNNFKLDHSPIHY